MRINKLQVKNFRNLIKVEYNPGPGLNILVGANAQGKTNILESIFLLATGSPFRQATDDNMVNYDAASYIITGNYDFCGRSLEASLQYKINSPKIALINNKKSPHNHKDRLRVVLFTPDDLFLVKGAPGKRRAFLDFIIRQLSSEYLYNLDNYINILKKRNLLLKKEQTNSKSFNIINDVFIENACRLVLQRINFVNILDQTTQALYQDLNDNQNELKIRYALSFAIDSDKINMAVLQMALRKKLEIILPEERRRHKTLVGPHLDDIHFYQDGRLARTFASQGQQRNIAIILKLAEIYTFYKIKKYYPIFLLDEVLAELDEGKRSLLINHLNNAPFQTFLTAVAIEDMDIHKNSILLVKRGCLLRRES